MSKPNLPPPSFYQKHEDVCGTEVGPPTPFWNQAAVEEAVRQALAAQRSEVIEDVACMICRRFDLNIPADLGPKLLAAIRSMSSPPETRDG